MCEPFSITSRKTDFFHCICLERKEKRIMKKTEMMKKNYEFRNVLSKGKYYSGDYIEAFIRANSKKKYNYLGIAISVKIAKAVRRNHIKRLIRENYRLIDKNIR